jgi:crotonobetainyl-CoA:carnitine CoA-transferase CaiB-like acyl-CoA transferase
MIDLTDEYGRNAFLKLVGSTDVVVDNYRPGVMDRLGLAHERLAEVNPLVTSVSISAFGGVGPLGMRPGFDPVVQAMSGIMRSQGGPDESNSPVFLTVPINDVLAAGLGAFGACSALFVRARIERGQKVNVTLCAASCLVQSEHLVRFKGRSPRPIGGRDFAGTGPINRLYRAADGWVRLDGRWPDDCASMGQAGLVATEVAALSNWLSDQQIVEAIAAELAQLPVAEVVRRCSAVGLPAVEARQPRQLVDDELLISHGLLTAIETSETEAFRVLPGRWLDLPGLVLAAPGKAPGPGEHGESILIEAGIPLSDMQRLQRTGVMVGGTPTTPRAGDR